ncbi:MAG: linear amide C-N hydrolase [Bacteroidetes bacterium]|nr:linear amide C-N hydrolase [Bacteroidota bacterium]MCK5764625.1 linear amide C-N hydrolase [Bacteroidales bacterium]
MAQAYLLILILLTQAFLHAQVSINCDEWDFESGTDLLTNDSMPFSIAVPGSGLLNNAQISFCPSGIERSSPNDVNKRHHFDWVVKYNNIYLKTSGGLVFEGMNEHGFSASLMFLNNSRLPEKDKEHIPIAASLSVNFFIDHFKCIDTALLAIWDIRIFDDLDLECGWPFRLILHDSSGATAYIEYVRGDLRVYTPESPALIVGGPTYARLITLGHFPDSIPAGKAEKRFLDITTNSIPDISWTLLQYYNESYSDHYYGILRDHMNKELLIMDPSVEELRLKFSEIVFTPGKVTTKNIF